MSKRDEGFLKAAITDARALQDALARLAQGEPVAHILGEWDFYDRTFFVTKDTPIPRPDTEHLVEYLIANLPQNAHFWDLCCGGGCIAITVLCHRPDLSALAVDLSDKALQIAQKNACRHKVQDRITFQKVDLLTDAPKGQTPDAIVSNPPYIQSALCDTLDASVRDYEPRMALDGGADGLDFYRVFLEKFLPQVPLCVLEIGYDLGDALRAMAKDLCPDYTCDVRRDYGGNERMVILKKASKE
jgi:release factor glutamine methyltransferase